MTNISLLSARQANSIDILPSASGLETNPIFIGLRDLLKHKCSEAFSDNVSGKSVITLTTNTAGEVLCRNRESAYGIFNFLHLMIEGGENLFMQPQGHNVDTPQESWTVTVKTEEDFTVSQDFINRLPELLADMPEGKNLREYAPKVREALATQSTRESEESGRSHIQAHEKQGRERIAEERRAGSRAIRDASIGGQQDTLAINEMMARGALTGKEWGARDALRKSEAAARRAAIATPTEGLGKSKDPYPTPDDITDLNIDDESRVRTAENQYPQTFVRRMAQNVDTKEQQNRAQSHTQKPRSPSRTR